MFEFVRKIYNRFDRQKWELVKVIKHTRIDSTYVYHIHLFESDKGNRRAEYKCDGYKYDIHKPGSWLRRTDLYQMQIYRWLHGRKDPDIPRYDQINEEDTANFLKGSV